MHVSIQNILHFIHYRLYTTRTQAHACITNITNSINSAYLYALLELGVPEGPGHGQLAHHAVVDDEAACLADSIYACIYTSNIVLYMSVCIYE